MTKEQYMKAGRMRVPVVCNGKQYARISEIVVIFCGELEKDKIHRNVPDELVFLRMIDKNGAKSTTLSPPEEVEVDPEIRAMYPGVFDNAET